MRHIEWRLWFELVSLLILPQSKGMPLKSSQFAAEKFQERKIECFKFFPKDRGCLSFVIRSTFCWKQVLVHRLENWSENLKTSKSGENLFHCWREHRQHQQRQRCEGSVKTHQGVRSLSFLYSIEGLIRLLTHRGQFFEHSKIELWKAGTLLSDNFSFYTPHNSY